MLIHGFMVNSGVGRDDFYNKNINDTQFKIYHSTIFIYFGSTLTKTFSKLCCFTEKHNLKVL